MKATYIRERTGERIDLFVAGDDPRTFMNVQFVTSRDGWEHVKSIPTVCTSPQAASDAMKCFALELLADGYTKQN